MQKKNLFSFHFQVHVTSPSLMAKLLKSRAQNKETRFFFYAIRKISILGRMLFCTKIIIKDDKVTKK